MVENVRMLLPYEDIICKLTVHPIARKLNFKMDEVGPGKVQGHEFKSRSRKTKTKTKSKTKKWTK